jgi:hypothetical protein
MVNAINSGEAWRTEIQMKRWKRHTPAEEGFVLPFRHDLVACCGVAWRGVMWCGVVWCGVAWCDVA